MKPQLNSMPSLVCISNYFETSYFSTWQEALKALYQSDRIGAELDRFIQYNIVMRDILRQKGIEGLLDDIFTIVPKDSISPLTIRYITKYWTENPIADYDIQMYHIDDDITILGHTFHGLNGVRQHCEMTASVRSQLHCFPTKEYIPLENIHIGEIYESYPIFDSYDYSDNRCYENYIFASEPIMEELMQQYANIKPESNYCMVHEKIPTELLPVLYYVGDGPYMVLATKKQTLE